MADTQRTLSALLTLLADNSTGAVGEGDIRDLLVSLAPEYAIMSFSSTAETSVATVNTALKCSGTTADTASSTNMTVATTNRITYDGTPDVIAFFFAAISMTAAGNNKVTSWYFAENGTKIAATRTQRKIGTGADIGSAMIIGCTTLSTDDYIELWCENNTDDTNMTVELASPVMLLTFMKAA